MNGSKMRARRFAEVAVILCLTFLGGQASVGQVLSQAETASLHLNRMKQNWARTKGTNPFADPASFRGFGGPNSPPKL